MLSKPRVESSDGRYLVGSISSASRSRIAFAYSVRFRRCRPGGGRCVDGVLVQLAFEPRRPSIQRWSRLGRGIPEGGIMPGAKLPDHQLPLFGMIGHVRRVQLVQLQTGRLQLLVMAGYAILIQEGALGGSVRNRLTKKGGHGCGEKDSEAYLHGT